MEESLLLPSQKKVAVRSMSVTARAGQRRRDPVRTQEGMQPGRTVQTYSVEHHHVNASVFD